MIQGKTLAFILPILESLINGPEKASRRIGYGRSPTILVLLPTRELAKQVIYIKLMLTLGQSVRNIGIFYSIFPVLIQYRHFWFNICRFGSILAVLIQFESIWFIKVATLILFDSCVINLLNLIQFASWPSLIWFICYNLIQRCRIFYGRLISTSKK